MTGKYRRLGASFWPHLGARRCSCLSTSGISLLLSAACASTYPQRLDYGLYPSPAMQRDMQYSVYTPPNWSVAERLPLVVLLHGAGDDPTTPDKAGVGQMLDDRLQAGDIPRVVVTWPQGDLGFWENWANGERNYRDWVSDELVPHIARRYHTLPCPDGCHLVGISMGGAGAMSFALKEPARWRSVSVLSAPVFQLDEVEELLDNFWLNLFIPVDDIWGPFDPAKAPRRDVYSRWQKPSDVESLSLLFTWGTEDKEDIRRTNERFASHLERHHIPARTFAYQGDHSWSSWREVLPRVLREQISASENPSSVQPRE